MTSQHALALRKGHCPSSTFVGFICCSTGVLNAAFLLKGAFGIHTWVTPYRGKAENMVEGGGAVAEGVWQ